MVVVLGGGLAGLAAGHALHRRGKDVVVLEQADRPGGIIRSAWRDGVLVEDAPQSLRGGASAVWPLLVALGLEDRVLRATDAARTRYLLHDGRLVALPGGPLGLLRTPLLSPRGRWRLLAEPLIPGSAHPGETVHDLLARRLGAEAADVLGTPFVGGIFGGDPRLVEAESALPRIARWAAAGSLFRGANRAPPAPPGAPRVPFTFTHGIEELPRALARALGDRLRLGTEVEQLTRRGAGWLVSSSRGTFEASKIVVALPPLAARRLLPDVPVPSFAPVAAVTLAFVGVPSPHGFGWLVHPRESADALGAIHVSSVFPAHAPGRTLLRVMIGGTRAPALPALSDDALIAHARRILAAVSGIGAEPVLAVVARSQIPQYPPGFAARVRASSVPLLGWGWTGPGVPDQIEAAEALADRL